MQRDDCKQVTGEADDHQIKGVRRMQTLNIGGSTTTTVSFIIERDAA
jgi:acetyl-CoA C-acetyltransferase